MRVQANRACLTSAALYGRINGTRAGWVDGGISEPLRRMPSKMARFSRKRGFRWLKPWPVTKPSISVPRGNGVKIARPERARRRSFKRRNGSLGKTRTCSPSVNQPNAPGQVLDRSDKIAYATGSPCTSRLLLSTPANSGCGSLPAQFAQPQKTAVVELSRPATAPMVRGL